MIHTLKLRNFRNFSQKEIVFEKNNFIYGENGIWKTNILEALSIFWTPLIDLDMWVLLKKGEQHLYIEIRLDNGKCATFSYDKETNKKKYTLNSKSTTKKKIQEFLPKTISFHPLGMNMMYLWPSKRREFIDHALGTVFPVYETTLRKYKKVVTSRNKVLKNISEGKSNIQELDFWNTAFIDLACDIYAYREKFISFIEPRCPEMKKYFGTKVENIQFIYHTKTLRNNVRESMILYLKKNQERDMFLKKTHIWRHVDDFDILLDDISITDFASRGEIKSTIIDLKFIEADFQKDILGLQPLFLIDDLMSELDEAHKDMIFEKIGDSQTVITSIQDLGYTGKNIKI